MTPFYLLYGSCGPSEENAGKNTVICHYSADNPTPWDGTASWDMLYHFRGYGFQAAKSVIGYRVILLHSNKV